METLFSEDGVLITQQLASVAAKVGSVLAQRNSLDALSVRVLNVHVLQARMRITEPVIWQSSDAHVDRDIVSLDAQGTRGVVRARGSQRS